PARAAVLFERYGTVAREVAAFLAEGPDAPVVGERLSTRELTWMVERERVVHLNDVLLRRTDLGFTGALGDDVVEAVATALADAAGWDAARRDAELARAREELAARHGILAPATR
ncbi:MAG TPA: glycerol-3-phosphate dehydrogenase C-terminal domain-containing protein, partial [Thermomicrobiales bacterium]|nr:glycerol-3-phosphate dehydrogenase C-terminal domain-containing protein [Thermomicrobiales bacterium]